ncbi:MAG TPA: hypothetical protein VF683_02220, partial [Chthoniobacterales bacterium]
ALTRAQLNFDHMLQRLMNERLAEVKLNEDIAFLSLRKAADRIEKREAVAAVDEFIAGLTRAGLSAGDACHYCGSPQEVQTVFNGDRVGQICNTCAKQQAEALLEQRRFDSKSLPKLAATMLPVLFALTGLWAALWLGVEALFVSHGGSLELPMKIAGLGAVAAGLGAATPALLFRGVKNRGNIGAGIFGGVIALVAAALGEITVSTIQLWTALGIISPRFGVYAAMQAVSGGNGHFLLLRGLALVSFVGFAFAFAKMPKAKLKL